MLFLAYCKATNIKQKSDLKKKLRKANNGK